MKRSLPHIVYFTLMVLCFYVGHAISAKGVSLRLPMIGYSGESPQMQLSELRKVIKNRDNDVDYSSQAIFSVFSNFAKVGMSKKEFNTFSLGDDWIDSSVISMVTIIGGKPAVDCQSGCDHFSIQLFGKIRPSPWTINICLYGTGEVSDAVNFFKETGVSKFTKMMNYTLTYPQRTVKSSRRRESFFWWGQRNMRPAF